jgi:transposase
MPVRSFSREIQWLLPPRIEELIPEDHPARFVAMFVDEFDLARWLDLGVAPAGEKEGAPAYHPALLTSVWLYGFMTGIRSCRRLEAACREQIPFIWLTANQKPDHNTLWRFYEHHRDGMRKLLRLTVRMAMRIGLVDLALQAVDGTKIAANAARDRTYDRKDLERLMQRVDAAIQELEAQNRTGGEQPPGHLPKELQDAQTLKSRLREAMAKLESDQHRSYVNLTDEDAALLKVSGGFVTGYNAQAMVSPLLLPEAETAGLLITAVAVTTKADQSQLLPLMEEAEANAGERAEMTLADAGYHSGQNLVDCEEQARPIAMPENSQRSLGHPYHKDAFRYDPESDTYRCPQGQTLSYRDTRKRDGKLVRRYRAEARLCRACPAFGLCTSDKRRGRALEIGPEDDALRRHRIWMQSAEAQEVYRRRKELPEPVFGILKEQLGARHFLLRGTGNVLAEWSLLATAFNLRTLARIWRLGTQCPVLPAAI